MLAHYVAVDVMGIHSAPRTEQGPESGGVECRTGPEHPPRRYPAESPYEDDYRR